MPINGFLNGHPTTLCDAYKSFKLKSERKAIVRKNTECNDSVQYATVVPVRNATECNATECNATECNATECKAKKKYVVFPVTLPTLIFGHCPKVYIKKNLFFIKSYIVVICLKWTNYNVDLDNLYDFLH